MKRLVLVVGVGRSGTSLLAGILGQLGHHLPQPEVTADDTNPRGFGEPRWVVDFHSRLLRARAVTVNDSRPAAWDATYGAADKAAVREELRAWLKGELEQGDVVVVKDPRTVWFLPLWRRCATDLGVETSYVTMLRHPAEIVRSAVKSYGTWQTEASRTAAWLNVALETERVTRGSTRAFIRYDELLAGWRGQLERAGTLIHLPPIAGDRAAAVDGFVDPSLHRNRVTWDDLDVPPRVVDLAERAWGELVPLAAPEGDTGADHLALDATRAEFEAVYAEAEAVAQSTVTAAKRAGRKKAKPAPPPTLKVRLARRIPARHRRRLRQAFGR